MAYRILLVDSDRVSRNSLIRALRSAGYLVDPAKDGSVALEIVKLAIRNNQRFDLIIIDTVMPKLGSQQLINDLAETCPELPILLVTSSGFRKSEFATELPNTVKKIVGKHFQPEEFLEVVTNLIEQTSKELGTS